MGLFLINNNVHQVMATPKKHGKDIMSSKEVSKKDLKNYYELYNIFENYSEEDSSKIIQILSNQEIIKKLKETIEEEKNSKKVLLLDNLIIAKNNLYKILLFIKTLSLGSFFYLTTGKETKNILIKKNLLIFTSQSHLCGVPFF